MAYRATSRHRQIAGILAGCNRWNKRISEAAVAGLVIYGWKIENYGEKMTKNLSKQIDIMRDDGNLEMSDQTKSKILDVLESGTVESIDKLRHWQSEISHRLDYHRLDHMNIEVITDMDKGIEILRSFTNPNPLNENCAPLYVDTENAHHDLRNYRFLARLALITVFDTYSKTVLLFRVQDLNDWQLEEVRYTLRDLNRNFVTFDDEKILSTTSGRGSIPFHKLQRHKVVWDDNSRSNVNQLQSLKEAVAEMPNGFNLDKMETMSDWTAPFLTHDQVCYAAMDAVVLHELQMWENEELRKKEWIETIKKPLKKPHGDQVGYVRRTFSSEYLINFNCHIP
ncbi:hypothetical protein CAEBREN_05344 [Caenorhabditis brenneri]|uniref:3'-5' exonuclease domain-containing protein n=1 Tax=Caenorhabditis brenneri TaxID=135651 RepID=G0P792_CAEBE|nr:hypothetical protein CAEBREN_05344 [Caenorhabditis brenneri]